jgi:hypothetical protein
MFFAGEVFPLGLVFDEVFVKMSDLCGSCENHIC